MVSAPSTTRLQDNCRDKQGLRPRKGLSAREMLKECQCKRSLPPEVEYPMLQDLGEDPEADLMALVSYDTLPMRAAWSGIRRDHYDIVKDMFKGRGTPINCDTRKADIMKFKDALLGYTLYFF